MSIRGNTRFTFYACYLGYVSQAIVNNFVPLLFLTFQDTFSLSLSQITLLTTVNFGIQLLVDLLSAGFIDRIGYRASAILAHVLIGLGLIGLTILPNCFSNPYTGLLAAICLYAIGGGLTEVLISPIVEACPGEGKAAAMSLLHSFYCWGHVFVVLLSTAFFVLFGTQCWTWLALVWAILPLGNALLFTQVPIYSLVETGEPGMRISELLRTRIFWVFMLLMLCAGASEQGMSQWASSFAESGLHVSKTLGDLAGPCSFAAMMGLSRLLYAKFAHRLALSRAMALSAGLCVVCYLTAALSSQAVLGLIGCALCGFSVGILWPGTFSMAAGVLRQGGTALFALLALAGDLGCSSGPTTVGLAASLMGGQLRSGLLLAILFPVLLLIGLWLYLRCCRKNSCRSKHSMLE